MLRFSKANTKLSKQGGKVYSFDLLSGWSCPFAKQCKSRVDIVDGRRKIRDFVDTQFRCFSASQEAQYTNVYMLRKENFETICECETVDEMADLIESAMPADAEVVRPHVAGDFFNETYFLAWLEVARRNPTKKFYAYTKALLFWVRHKSQVDALPNVVLTASYGGTHDHLIAEHGLRYAIVVGSVEDADALGLEVDDDDTHASDVSRRFQSFALVVHGTQPKGSEYAKIVTRNNRLKVLA